MWPNSAPAIRCSLEQGETLLGRLFLRARFRGAPAVRDEMEQDETVFRRCSIWHSISWDGPEILTQGRAIGEGWQKYALLEPGLISRSVVLRRPRTVGYWNGVKQFFAHVPSAKLIRMGEHLDRLFFLGEFR